MPDGPYTHMRRGIIHGATPGMKLIHFGANQYQLYDLARDPAESEDVASDATLLGPMLQALQAKRATLREISVAADVPETQYPEHSLARHHQHPPPRPLPRRPLLTQP